MEREMLRGTAGGGEREVNKIDGWCFDKKGPVYVCLAGYAGHRVRYFIGANTWWVARVGQGGRRGGEGGIEVEAGAAPDEEDNKKYHSMIRIDIEAN